MSSDHSPSPVGPVAATLAAVIHQDRILLIRRANRPDAGRWAFPGGKIRAGETIMAAAHRELAEETGVQGQALQVFDALDVFDREPSATPLAYSHFILIAVLFRWQQGEPQAGDDALDGPGDAGQGGWRVFLCPSEIVGAGAAFQGGARRTVWE